MPAINGAHVIVFSKDPDADRKFFRNVIGAPHVDVGGGWLIFGLPPAEVAVHPSDGGGAHELYLMCDDVEAFVADMKKRAVVCGPVADRGWGLLTEVTLPGGGKIGVYEPRHARPKAMAGGPSTSVRTRAAKKRRPKPKKTAAKRKSKEKSRARSRRRT